MSTISASTTTTTAYKVAADTTGTLVFQTGATPTTAVTIDGSQNVGIGTSTIISKLTVAGGVSLSGGAGTGNAFYPYYNSATSYNAIGSDSNGGMTFITGISSPSIRATIDNSGNLLVGTASQLAAAKQCLQFDGSAQQGFAVRTTYATLGSTYFTFQNSAGTQAGFISQNGTTTVSYATSSDYRLKENVQPMAGALQTVARLKPVTYTWKADGTDGQGFIAHELQDVVPDCVSGSKDAVDSDGNPVYQGIDTSFLIATLTAAIQELKAELDAAKADIATLKG
jgi:Chaperone of endosialidase